jgi:hypothetical protein
MLVWEMSATRIQKGSVLSQAPIEETTELPRLHKMPEFLLRVQAVDGIDDDIRPGRKQPLQILGACEGMNSQDMTAGIDIQKALFGTDTLDFPKVDSRANS